MTTYSDRQVWRSLEPPSQMQMQDSICSFSRPILTSERMLLCTIPWLVLQGCSCLFTSISFYPLTECFGSVNFFQFSQWLVVSAMCDILFALGQLGSLFRFGCSTSAFYELHLANNILVVGKSFLLIVGVSLYVVDFVQLSDAQWKPACPPSIRLQGALALFVYVLYFVFFGIIRCLRKREKWVEEHMALPLF